MTFLPFAFYFTKKIVETKRIQCCTNTGSYFWLNDPLASSFIPGFSTIVGWLWIFGVVEKQKEKNITSYTFRNKPTDRYAPYRILLATNSF